MASSLTWKPPTFKVPLFVCLLSYSGRPVPPPSHSLCLSGHLNCRCTFCFTYFSWNCNFYLTVFILKLGNVCLDAHRINPFFRPWWPAAFPLTAIFKKPFLPLQNNFFLSLEVTDFRLWTNMVLNPQTFPCLTYTASFSIAPLLRKHSTSDKENKFFCWKASRDPSH